MDSTCSVIRLIKSWQPIPGQYYGNRLMNSNLLRGLTISFLVLLVLLLSCFWYLRHASSEHISKLERLSQDLKTLRVGTSTYQQVRAIAERYGTAKFDNDWGIRDCADGYFEKCAYQISIKSPVMNRLGGKLPWLQYVGLRPWSSNAHIFIDDGKVAESHFSVIFKLGDAQWRGFGAEEYKSLPERAVEATISASYLVSRNDIIISDERNGLGYSLDSSVTPGASESERERAWHFEFQCLASSKGCNEICDVMPEAWHDFYINRGRLDVQKYGNKYLFCNQSDVSR
jgi:hypothetical protein